MCARIFRAPESEDKVGISSNVLLGLYKAYLMADFRLLLDHFSLEVLYEISSSWAVSSCEEVWEFLVARTLRFMAFRRSVTLLHILPLSSHFSTGGTLDYLVGVF